MALEAVSNRSFTCPHGVGRPSVCTACRELEQLIEEQRRDRMARGDRRALSVDSDDGWGAAQPAQGTSLLERARAVATEIQRQCETSGTSPEALARDIVTAERIRLITPLQGALLTAQLTLTAEGRRPSWREIARRAGCSPTTAKRHSARAQAITRANGRGRSTTQEIVVCRVRGARAREVWIRYTDRFGHWSQTWGELVTDRQRRAEPLRVPRHDDQITTPIRSSAMNVLFGALIRALADPPILARGLARHPMASPDWAHNLRWAQRRVVRAQRRKRPWICSASNIYNVLARGCRLCRYCHAPILVGCSVGGIKIYRNKTFCEDACKLKYHRRHRRADLRRVEGRTAAVVSPS